MFASYHYKQLIIPNSRKTVEKGGNVKTGIFKFWDLQLYSFLFA